MRITIDIDKDVTTVGDVRKWLAEVERLGLNDDTRLEDTAWLCVAHRPASWSFIECGDHREGPLPKDLLVDLHDCMAMNNLDVPGKPE